MFFWIPLSVIRDIGSVTTIMEQADLLSGSVISWYAPVSIAVTVLLIIAGIVAEYGMIKRRWLGPCALFVYFGLGIAISAVVVILTISLGFGWADCASQFTSMILFAVILVLSYIYYRSRRMLFSPYGSRVTL